MEFLHYSPFEGQKFQVVGKVVRFGFCQTPTDIGNNSIHTIIMSLVEHSPKTRPASISMEFKWPGEICTGKNRCCDAQAL